MVFSTIAAEDLDFMHNAGSNKIPEFGYSTSDYDEVSKKTNTSRYNNTAMVDCLV